MAGCDADDAGESLSGHARREAGYAMVAAVMAVAVFAYIAFQVLAADRGDVIDVQGRAEHVRLSAVADAGIMIAIHDLALADRDARWNLDGTPRRADFAGDVLTITVEDERGKAPLVGLDAARARALFEGAGARGERLDALVDEFERWRTAKPEGGEDADAPVRFRTPGELMALPDMDAALYARIAPAVTAFFEQMGPFDARNAGPLAIATMSTQDTESPAAPGDQPEALAQRAPAEAEVDADDERLMGRPITVRVIVQDRSGARAHRMAIVEFTGSPIRPWWIRYVE